MIHLILAIAGGILLATILIKIAPALLRTVFLLGAGFGMWYLFGFDGLKVLFVLGIIGALLVRGLAVAPRL